MFDHDHFNEIKKGLLLFNKEQFWECHEELEDVWMEYSHDPIKYISWAIIQVATSLYHVRNENLAGAHGMLSKAVQKLKKCEELRIETKVLNDSLNWQLFKSLVYSIKEDDNLNAFNGLYKFKFPGI